MSDAPARRPPPRAEHPAVNRAEWLRKAARLAALDRDAFQAPPWLRHAHLQTTWSPLLRPRPRLPWRREILTTPDDDRLHLHHLDGGAPTVVLMHGLEGSVASNYMCGLGAAAAGLGWSVAAVEARSCSGELNRARRLYHSGETSDLDFVVETLVARDPGRRLYLAGVSLGANVTAKWLGERGDSVPPAVKGAAAISPPFDLSASGPAIDRALGGLYVRRFLRTLIPKAIAKERQYPGCLDVEAVARSRSFAEFDTYATAALHGFRDAEDYWAKVGCGQFLPGIRRPTLLVASADDPFNPGTSLPHAAVASSAFLYPRFTRSGGHVGFVYGHPWRTRHWAEEQVIRFFQLLETEQA